MRSMHKRSLRNYKIAIHRDQILCVEFFTSELNSAGNRGLQAVFLSSCACGEHHSARSSQISHQTSQTSSARRRAYRFEYKTCIIHEYLERNWEIQTPTIHYMNAKNVPIAVRKTKYFHRVILYHARVNFPPQNKAMMTKFKNLVRTDCVYFEHDMAAPAKNSSREWETRITSNCFILCFSRTWNLRFDIMWSDYSWWSNWLSILPWPGIILQKEQNSDLGFKLKTMALVVNALRRRRICLIFHLLIFMDRT